MSAHDELDIEQQGGFGDDPRATYIVFSGVVGTLVLIVSVFVLQALTYQYEARENQRKLIDQQWTERMHREAAEHENLRRHRWVDEAKGIVGIPADEAMKIVIREQGAVPTTQPRPQ